MITSSDSEGAGEVFSVWHSGDELDGSKDMESTRKYFKAPKYLTVSSQLHLEALALAVGKVWALSPTFRAEKSDTPRHLSEFYMLEAEMAFLDDLGILMDMPEKMIKHVLLGLTGSKIGAELLSAKLPKNNQSTSESYLNNEMLSKRWRNALDYEWPRITYREALALIQNKITQRTATFTTDPNTAKGLQNEHERFLVQEVGNGCPVFVTEYPQKNKPFYMAANSHTPNGEPATVACFDLLVPELGEIVGGSIREHRLPELLASMKEKGLSVPSDASGDLNSITSTSDPLYSDETNHVLDWYLDLRRYGSVSHGGFGLGFDRFLAYMAGVSNIRDVVAFPRWYGRCDC